MRSPTATASSNAARARSGSPARTNDALAIHSGVSAFAFDDETQRGGHVAVAAYEWIRTKKGAPYYRGDITKLFPVAAVFIAFLLVFVVAGIYLDITHPLQIPH